MKLEHEYKEKGVYICLTFATNSKLRRQIYKFNKVYGKISSS